MTNLTRYFQKIFAKNSNQIGVFGTGVNKQASTNVETLQSADYEEGWSAAIITNKNYPVYQEMDGVMYGMTYQLAYLLQKGVPEWLNTETYYQTDMCKVGNTIYISLVDNNINHNPLSHDGYWSVYTGNNNQVTNCLLEVPQRINYTLVDGVFTVKAGSVMIVPYGTTDLSSTYSVGDTFIHSDLKVYDTYWDSTNSKFFVWVEAQTDIVREVTASSSVVIRALALYFDADTIGITAYGNSESGSSDSSASNTSLFYNTTSNLVKRKDSGTILSYTCSFPIVKVVSDTTYMVAEVRQVFNGVGYIGAITWADKGIKGLIPNGRNADGTLKNDEFTTQTLMTYAVAASLGLAGYRYLCLSADILNSVYPMNAFYDATKNTFQLSGGSHVAKIGTILTDSNGKIISQSLDGALNINSMCDGGWVDLNLTIASSVTAPSSGTPLEYDLSSYLPTDDNNYEVILTGVVTTGTTSGNTVSLRVYSNILNNYQTITTAQTRSSSSVSGGGTLTLPVGLDKKIYVSSYSGNSGTFSLLARGYRRLGTNA